MPEQGLSHFIIHTKALQASCEGMPEIVKPKVLESDSSSGFKSQYCLNARALV
jgi:hypothetical protein